MWVCIALHCAPTKGLLKDGVLLYSFTPNSHGNIALGKSANSRLSPMIICVRALFTLSVLYPNDSVAKIYLFALISTTIWSGKRSRITYSVEVESTLGTSITLIVRALSEGKVLLVVKEMK